MTPSNKSEQRSSSSSAEDLVPCSSSIDKDESDARSASPSGPLETSTGTGCQSVFRLSEAIRSNQFASNASAVLDSSGLSYAPPNHHKNYADRTVEPSKLDVSADRIQVEATSLPSTVQERRILPAQDPSTPTDCNAGPAATQTLKSAFPSLHTQEDSRTKFKVATPTRRIASSASSPAFSSNGSNGIHSMKEEESGSDRSNAVCGEASGRSGVTPPMETTSISSDPQVPTTVEVPSQPKMTSMARPASTPNLRSPQMVLSGVPPSVSLMPPIQAQQSHQKPRSGSSLRRGKWTVEEEAYVARVIQDFNSGYLNAPAGTTLRSYLSDKLRCDPMRITKKFTGDSCIGKRVFHPAVRCPSNTAAIDKAQAELDALERRWRRRLEMQQRESAKKAAASAAAAAAASSSGRGHFHTSPSQPTSVPQTQVHGNHQQLNQTIVTRTASWLDRANAILSTGQSGSSQPSSHDQASGHAQAVRSLPAKEIEDQMKEVQRLIHEGPIIQQTTAGLPHLLDNPSNAHSYPTSGKDSPTPPLDKRARHMDHSDVVSGAADAEALVGFLNSVRAAAAADPSGCP